MYTFSIISIYAKTYNITSMPEGLPNLLVISVRCSEFPAAAPPPPPPFLIKIHESSEKLIFKINFIGYN